MKSSGGTFELKDDEFLVLPIGSYHVFVSGLMFARPERGQVTELRRVNHGKKIGSVRLTGNNGPEIVCTNPETLPIKATIFNDFGVFAKD